MYEGGWKDDKRQGKGKMIFADGAVYEGGWNDGMIHGGGKMTYDDGMVVEPTRITHRLINDTEGFFIVKFTNLWCKP